MLYLEGNEISVTRGDTAIFDFTINEEFKVGDVVYFSVKKSPNDVNYAINKVITEFDGNTARIVLTNNDTKIPKGKYWYDIQCSMSDGRVDTVINKERFIILEEINNE